MTTETTSSPRVPPRDTGARALVGAALVTAVVGLALIAVAALTGGSAAAGGALVGILLVLGVFGFGAFAVNLVAHVMPAAALMVALLTYVLQVVVMAVVFAALSRSGALDDTLDRGWLGGTVIAGTAAWIVVQLVVATTRRIPVYDLPAQEYAGSGAGRTEGGEA